jgi:hypothetical protein
MTRLRWNRLDRRRGRTMILTAVITALVGTGAARASQDWIVLDVRGAALKSGERVAPGSALRLPEGARVTLIARTGRSLTLRGLFDGSIPRIEGDPDDPRRALSALIAARDERVRTIGVVRSGHGSARLPDPWLIDISRAGPRCLHERQASYFWRPPGTAASLLTIWPTDRSWRVDFAWPEDHDRVPIPPGLRPMEGQTLVAEYGDREHAIGFTVIAPSVSEPVLIAAWMIEKGCIQQADAFLDALHRQASPGAATTDRR